MVELAYLYPYLVTVSEPLGVNERLIVSKRLTVSKWLEEHDFKKYKLKKYKLKEHKPKEHKQLPKRLWLDIIVLILAAPILNIVTYKILTEAIY